MCLELRELCDGGELFDILIDEPDGCAPADALKMFVQLVDAVAFCHEVRETPPRVLTDPHMARCPRSGSTPADSPPLGRSVSCSVWQRGAVHGQLQAENVVVGNGRLQVSGFYCCVPVRPNASGEAGASTRGSESAPQVELRPWYPTDAPELQGVTEIDPSKLFA
jgi:hypothetical protein